MLTQAVGQAEHVGPAGAAEDAELVLDEHQVRAAPRDRVGGPKVVARLVLADADDVVGVGQAVAINGTHIDLPVRHHAA